MKRELVKERQPFGEVRNEVTMPSTFATPKGMGHKALGPEMMRGNDGLNQPQSASDKNPGAYDQACKNRDNPFVYVGHPKRSV